MFSVFEKIRFIIVTKLSLRNARENDRKINNNDSLMVRIVKRIVKIIIITFISLLVFGIFISNLTAPTITVSDSNDKTIYTDGSSYMIKGRIISGNESYLKINHTEVELIGGDFTFEANLKNGDNRFVFEATNSRGTTREIYIIHSKHE